MLGLILILSGCRDKSGLLVNEWRIKNLRYTEKITPELQGVVDDWVHQMQDSFTLVYKSDGTYESRLGTKAVTTGKWEYNRMGSAINTKGNDGQTTSFKVLELSSGNLQFEANQNGSKVIFDMVPANKK